MNNLTTVHCYVSELISNEDGQYDKFTSSWFTVSSEWLLQHIQTNGFRSLEDFYSTYTYDDTDGLMQLAIQEGVLMGCGVGLMENHQ